MSNILQNPNLEGFTLERHFWDKNGNTGSIEYPDHWEYTATSQDPEDPGLIPQSLHRPKGFAISAGYRAWEAGYVQRGISLKAGQRYLAKAVFFPDVNFPAGAATDLTAISWRFWMQRVGSDEKAFQDWQITDKGQFKVDHECLFVFQCNEDLQVDYYFKARSPWAGNVCDLNIYSLTLEPVAADYGGPDVPQLGTAGATTTPSPTEETTTPQPVETTATASTAVAANVGGADKLDLSDVLSSNDIDVIAAGLKRMETLTNDKVITEAFNRLAEALEKLR